jgi:indolepyruvate decarboxylase
VRLDDAARAPADIARVLGNCLRAREPVYIEIPRDMVAEPCAPVPCREAPQRWTRMRWPPAWTRSCSAWQASSPVLMAGVEVRRYGLEAQVAELARRLGAAGGHQLHGPRPAGRPGCAADGHLHGRGRLPEVTHLVEDSDGLFLLGVIICRTPTSPCRRRRSTCARRSRRSMAEVTMGYHTYSTLPLAAVVDRMLACVRHRRKPLAVTPQAFPHGLVADAATIAPTDIATAVNDLMAEHGKPADRVRHGRLPVHRDGH